MKNLAYYLLFCFLMKSALAPGQSTYAKIDVGDRHSLALKPDGTLWAWGINDNGQLGNGTWVNRNTPVKIGPGYSAIAAGYAHSLALKPDGTLWAWGYNGDGQLGDGTRMNANTHELTGLGFAAIDAGDHHSLALKTDGTLWAWGFNNNDEFGLEIGPGYSAIAAGDYHSLALKPDGTLWAWGANSNGQLGDGTLGYTSTPVQIGSGYAAIAAGAGYSLALKTDGTLWAWGINDHGQLGDGTWVDKNTPVQIGSGYATIAAGGGFRQNGNSSGHSLGVKTDGTLWAWGANDVGQLGDGTLVDKSTPAQIGYDYTAIAAGGGYSLALKTDGTLWGWGINDFGQLGDGTYLDKNTPSLQPSPPLSAPVALPATFVSNTGFEAEWNNVNGMTEYQLDVSTSDTFASFVNGYEDKVISSSNVGILRGTVAGLLPKTKYFYRVRGL